MGQNRRAGFTALAHARIGHRDAVADRDHIALADEQVRLSERDASVQHLRGARHDEQRVAVLFDLGLLMRLAGILDRKRMQIELLLDPLQQVRTGLVESDPDDVVGTFGPGAGLVDRNVGDALALHVDASRDDARFVTGDRSNPLDHVAPPSWAAQAYSLGALIF